MKENSLSLEDFLKIIKNKKIIDCYLANTKEEKEEINLTHSYLSESGKKRLQDSKLLTYHNVKSVDIDFDYGFHSFVLELEDGSKIIIKGSEWNIIELDCNDNPGLLKQ